MDTTLVATKIMTETCRRLRIDLIELLHSIQTGHPGGSLSACEIITTLYLNRMNVDASAPRWDDRDRFILSKGHAAPMLYLVLAEMGFFPKEELRKLRQLGHMLQGHPSMSKIPGVDLSTGPLGLGLSAGVGMALAAKQLGKSYTTYVLLGDGELQEGGVWEAMMSAAKFRLHNLVAILDYNGVQLDGTLDEVMPLGDVAAKFCAFGWEVLHVDGHSIEALLDSYARADAVREGPVVIIARTVKGKGVSFMEGQSFWHGNPIGDAQYARCIAELRGQEV